MNLGLFSAFRSPSSRLITTNGPSGCLLGKYVRKVPARNAPNRTEVPIYAAMLIKADNTRTINRMLETWSNLANLCSIQRRKMGAKTHLVKTGVRIAMPAEATIGRPMIQPRLTLPASGPESSFKSPMTLLVMCEREFPVAKKDYGLPGQHKAHDIVDHSCTHKHRANSSLSKIYCA